MAESGGTWTCHVCGDSRPDAMVAVHSREGLVNGITVRTNVRYCADRAGCAVVAPLMARDRAALGRGEPRGR